MRYCPNDKCQFLKDHRSRSTYEDNVEKCLDCGAALASGTPTPPPANIDDEPVENVAEMVTVATFPNPHAAYWAKAGLEAGGVPAFLQAASESQTPQSGEQVLLRVPAPYAADARRMLDEVAAACDDAEPPAPEDFEGEEDEATEEFPVCAQCGAPLAAPRRGLFGALFGGSRRSRVAVDAEGRPVCARCGAPAPSQDPGGEDAP